MIKSIKDMIGYSVRGTDGDIGRVHDFIFDEDGWAVRYVAVNTGDWLTGRRVLVSPIAVSNANWNDHRVDINLTREQVRNSPEIDADRPILREQEEKYHQYYSWPYYWAGGGLWGAGMSPGALAGSPVPAVPPGEPTLDKENPETARTEAQARASHLHSAAEVIGYRIQAVDGLIGDLEDFLIEDQTWRVEFLVVATSNWLFGKQVVIPPGAVQHVDWVDHQVQVDLTKETIQSSPEFNPETTVNRA